MSELLYGFDPVVPAGTPIAAPVTFALSMAPCRVDQIEVHVPPGPNGNLGFAFAAAGQPIIPVNAGAFIIADDDHFLWSLQNLITSGAWQLIAHNTGVYDHQVFIRFLVSLVGASQPAPPAQLIPADTLVSPADTTPLLVPDLIAGA